MDHSDFYFSCPACKDEGLPARVLAIDERTRVATAQLNGGESEVALDLLDDVRVGDFVLVHLDTAIAKLNPADVVED
ncbi:MAG: HypC/HybG/HupF family hydrogenase formation chaperone [Chloroflexota bacterium]